MRGTGKSPGAPTRSRRARPRLLRRHRVGRPAALVQRARGPERHLLFRDDAMAGRELRPPSLAAMIPWEGAADMYRDFGYHGGIFSFGFVVNWYNNHMAHHLLGRPQATAPDAFATPWVGVHAPRPRQRLVPRTPADLGEHRLSRLQRGQLERDGAAPAWQHRGYPRSASRHKKPASTPAPTTTASTRRKAGTTSSASSITG